MLVSPFRTDLEDKLVAHHHLTNTSVTDEKLECLTHLSLLSVQDYHHSLVCVTEREQFEVPIRAIGPRAILDFRDELHLPACPVKASTERTQLVHNKGNSKAKFKLHTQR